MSSSAEDRRATLDLGEVAPDFTLLDADRVQRSLTGLCAARPLVLVFYRGHW